MSFQYSQPGGRACNTRRCGCNPNPQNNSGYSYIQGQPTVGNNGVGSSMNGGNSNQNGMRTQPTGNLPYIHPGQGRQKVGRVSYQSMPQFPTTAPMNVTTPRMTLGGEGAPLSTSDNLPSELQGNPNVKYVQLKWEDILGGKDGMKMNVSMAPQSGDSQNANRQMKISFGQGQDSNTSSGDVPLRIVSFNPVGDYPGKGGQMMCTPGQGRQMQSSPLTVAPRMQMPQSGQMTMMPPVMMRIPSGGGQMMQQGGQMVNMPGGGRMMMMPPVMMNAGQARQVYNQCSGCSSCKGSR